MIRINDSTLIALVISRVIAKEHQWTMTLLRLPYPSRLVTVETTPPFSFAAFFLPGPEFFFVFLEILWMWPIFCTFRRSFLSCASFLLNQAVVNIECNIINGHQKCFAIVLNYRLSALYEYGWRHCLYSDFNFYPCIMVCIYFYLRKLRQLIGLHYKCCS